MDAIRTPAEFEEAFVDQLGEPARPLGRYLARRRLWLTPSVRAVLVASAAAMAVVCMCPPWAQVGYARTGTITTAAGHHAIWSVSPPPPTAVGEVVDRVRLATELSAIFSVGSAAFLAAGFFSRRT